MQEEVSLSLHSSLCGLSCRPVILPYGCLAVCFLRLLTGAGRSGSRPLPDAGEGLKEEVV